MVSLRGPSGQDQARGGQQGTLTRIWAPRGSRPRAPRDTRYTWACIFGAVCPERGATAALVMPNADTAAITAQLAEISRTVTEGAHAVVHRALTVASGCSNQWRNHWQPPQWTTVLDGAGWHGAKALKVPDNITLLPLPP